jgi:competence protein ComEC
MGRTALAGVLLLLWSGGPAPAQNATVELVFLDVGQGDAIVVRSPEGKVALIDSGDDATIVHHLRSHGIDSIDIAIASHPHADHIGGMEAVLRGLPVRYYMDAGVPHTTATYRSLLSTLVQSDATYLEATIRTLTLGSVTIRVLPPMPDAGSLNNQSIGLLVEHGDFKALLTGDSEIEELNYFIGLGVPQVTVLKAAHHGSRNGVSPGWLSATKPEVVVISVGRGNPYGHPHEWALRYYAAATDAVYRTDLHGEVTILGDVDGTFDLAFGHQEEIISGPPPRQSSVPPTPAEGQLRLWVYADAPGNDHYNLNGEYVVLQNAGDEAVRIGGWSLCDAVAHCFTFPDGAVLAASETAVVYTGSGQNDGRSFFMNRGRAVWNNRGDVATLRDAAGNLVLRYAY